MPRIVLNCFIVSIFFALITPAFFVIEYIPKEGAEVPQFNDIDLHVLKESSGNENGSQEVQSIKMRKIYGLERIMFVVKQPFFLKNYLNHSQWVFIPFFLATLFISFWNICTYKRLRNGV